MRHLVARLAVLLVAVGLSGPALAQQPSPDPPAQPAAAREARSPWIKPKARMIVNLEYAQGIEDNRGVYVKLGCAW
jgi:hypothetical protein